MTKSGPYQSSSSIFSTRSPSAAATASASTSPNSTASSCGRTTRRSGPELAQHVGVRGEAVRRQHQLEVDAALLADLPQREGEHLRPLGREHDAHRRLARDAYAGPAGRAVAARPPSRTPRSAGRRSTTLCSSRASGSSRSTGAVSASTTAGPAARRRRCPTVPPTAARRPWPARPRDRGAGVDARATGHAEPTDRSDRTRPSVGSLGRASEAELDHRPVDVGHEADRVEDPLVERADGRPRSRRDRRPPGHDVLRQRTGRSQHHVRRDVALLDGLDGARPVVHDEATRSHRARPDGLPAQLADHVGGPDRLLEPGDHEVPVGDRLRPERLHRRPLRSRDEPRRRRQATRPTPPRRAPGRRAAPPQPGGRPGRATATSTRAYFPAYAGSGRITRVGQVPAWPTSRAPAARHPGPGTRGPARGGQTSAGAHDGSRRTSGRSARGSQLVATWSMTCTPGGATIRSSPGTSSPRPSASAV